MVLFDSGAWRDAYREETDCAWKVAADFLRQNNFNFDLRHPSQSGGAVIRTRSEVSQGIELASSELAKSASQLLEALKLSGTVLPPTINPPCKTIQELGIGLISENRNPEKSPAEEFIYVDLSSVDHNVIESLKRIKGSEAPSRARRVIRENDVILSTVRPYLGGHAVVPETLDNQICSTRFSVLRCPDHVNPTFLYFMLISPQVVAQFHSCMRGSHYPALNDDHVRNLLIPDLSRDKQDEIVGKLENLIEQIEASVTRIEAFSQLLNGEANAALSSLLADAYGTFAEKEKRGEY